MNHALIVKNNIKINATPEKVWEVLTNPYYIKQWDELPEDFGDEAVSASTIINFPGFSKLTVTGYEPGRVIRYQLYVDAWGETVIPDINYSYHISQDANGETWLGIEIGDFAVLTDGSKYYDESINFGNTASQKIKELAEDHTVISIH